MKALYQQIRDSHVKYGFAEVVPVGNAHAIKIITSKRGKTPVFGYASYSTGEPLVWLNVDNAHSFLAEALDGL